MQLANRTALITGASQGLGRTIAQEFWREGAHLLLCARSEGDIAALADELRASAQPGQKVVAQTCDVSASDQVAALFETAVSEFGGLQVLVNNAGIYGPKGLSEEVDWDEWTKAIEINLYGTFLPCRAAIPLFKAANYGKIINLSGGGATNPLPRLSSYAASKAAVVRLSETLALELKEYNVDVNAVAPGALNTRLLDEVLEAGPEKVGAAFYAKAQQQAQSGGVPLEKGARLCVYLASAQSDGITGRLISAQWDPWPTLHERREELDKSDIYALRRIVPEDRGQSW